MHFSNQWTGRVEHLQPAPVCFLLDRLRNTMSTENNNDVTRHYIQLVNENCTALAQGIHDEFVVNNFMTHINRRAEYIERTINNIDCAVYTSTETARNSEFGMHKLNESIRIRFTGLPHQTELHYRLR